MGILSSVKIVLELHLYAYIIGKINWGLFGAVEVLSWSIHPHPCHNPSIVAYPFLNLFNV